MFTPLYNADHYLQLFDLPVILTVVYLSRAKVELLTGDKSFYLATLIGGECYLKMNTDRHAGCLYKHTVYR